jgi:hypothetical protein
VAFQMEGVVEYALEYNRRFCLPRTDRQVSAAGHLTSLRRMTENRRLFLVLLDITNEYE